MIPNRAPAHTTPSSAQRVRTVKRQEAHRRVGAGDEHVDHRVVEALHDPAGARRARVHVVCGARRVEQDHREAVHPRGDNAGLRPGIGEQPRDAADRRERCELVQPAPEAGTREGDGHAHGDHDGIAGRVRHGYPSTRVARLARTTGRLRRIARGAKRRRIVTIATPPRHRVDTIRSPVDAAPRRPVS